MFRSDFYFFDFFAENFSFFENPTSENPKISVTIGFPIVILGRKSSKSVTSDFSESRTTPDPTVVQQVIGCRVPGVLCFFTRGDAMWDPDCFCDPGEDRSEIFSKKLNKWFYDCQAPTQQPTSAVDRVLGVPWIFYRRIPYTLRFDLVETYRIGLSLDNKVISENEYTSKSGPKLNWWKNVHFSPVWLAICIYPRLVFSFPVFTLEILVWRL